MQAADAASKRSHDENLFRIMREKLYTGVVCDSLDDLGYRNQAMQENVRPMSAEMVVVGRAKTILAVDVFHVHDNPYDMEIEALDSMLPGEVAVVCTNQSKNNGVWGELLSTATIMRGGTGAIIDGFVRDTKQIREIEFPVFCTGYRPVDSKGRGIVVDFDCPVVVGGIQVFPGDIIFGDNDGVVVIPQAMFEQTIQNAVEKVEKENHTRTELREGKLLREVYDKYGVL